MIQSTNKQKNKHSCNLFSLHAQNVSLTFTNFAGWTPSVTSSGKSYAGSALTPISRPVPHLSHLSFPCVVLSTCVIIQFSSESALDRKLPQPGSSPAVFVIVSQVPNPLPGTGEIRLTHLLNESMPIFSLFRGSQTREASVHGEAPKPGCLVQIQARPVACPVVSD